MSCDMTEYNNNKGIPNAEHTVCVCVRVVWPLNTVSVRATFSSRTSTSSVCCRVQTYGLCETTSFTYENAGDERDPTKHTKTKMANSKWAPRRILSAAAAAAAACVHSTARHTHAVMLNK